MAHPGHPIPPPLVRGGGVQVRRTKVIMVRFKGMTDGGGGGGGARRFGKGDKLEVEDGNPTVLLTSNG